MRAAPERDARRPTCARWSKPIPPRVVATGPVKDVDPAGDQVDLYACRRSSTTRATPAPYLTAAISFAKDPASETWNCAYNRLMIQGRDTTSIHLTLGKHLWEFQRSPRRAASRCPWPSPSACIRPSRSARSPSAPSTRTSAPSWAALLGEPLELVKCETSDVLVPAHAEMVIEAEILPGARTAEGPFGEFTGYSLGERAARGGARSRPSPTARGAMFQDITVAHLDHMLLSTIPMEANLYRAVRAMVPSVKAVRVPGALHLLRVDRAAPARPGQERDPRRARRRPLHEARGGRRPRRGRLRRPADELGHRHALPARPRHHDHHATRAARTSTRPPARTATRRKWGVDATAKPSLAAYTPRHRVPPDVWQRLDLKAFERTSRGPPRACRGRFDRAGRRLAAAATARTPAALVWDGGALTLRELARRAGGVARRLAARGVAARRSRRAARSPTAGASPSRCSARSRLGATVAPAQSRCCTPTERARILADLAAARRRGPSRATTRRPTGRRSRSRDAPALVLYTSGSTGRPKGAVLSHAALAARATESWAGPGDGAHAADDACWPCCRSPHSFGLNGALLAPLLAGATRVPGGALRRPTTSLAAHRARTA